MAEVVMADGKWREGDEQICGQCARKGDCPLKEGFKKTGRAEEWPDSMPLFCHYHVEEVGR